MPKERTTKERTKRKIMLETPSNVIIQSVCRFLAPFVQLFALFIIAHGHYFPGGGFQGGVLWALSFILLVIADGQSAIKRLQSEKLTYILSCGGALVFGGIGLMAVFFGGQYLNYGVIPLPFLSAPYVRYLSILIVEIGIGITVMAVLTAIFFNMAEERKYY